MGEVEPSNPLPLLWVRQWIMQMVWWRTDPTTKTSDGEVGADVRVWLGFGEKVAIAEHIVGGRRMRVRFQCHHHLRQTAVSAWHYHLQTHAQLVFTHKRVTLTTNQPNDKSNPNLTTKHHAISIRQNNYSCVSCACKDIDTSHCCCCYCIVFTTSSCHCTGPITNSL